jgi:hypothetical protein
MTDPRRPRRPDQAGHGSGPTERLHQPYPVHTDPAYVGQTPYWPAYGPGYLSTPGPNLTESNPTERLPQYWQQGHAPGETGPQVPPPEGPKSPRWLWIAASAALLLVVALLIALVISNGSAKKQTAVEPLPAMPRSSSTAPPPVTSPSSSATAAPTMSPTQTTSAAATQTVVYNVTGEGRAISITYVDSDGVRQTEFNVALPWSKEVSLSTQDRASVTIINIGHDVTCSVTVAGAQVRKHTGAGLTVCTAD